MTALALALLLAADPAVPPAQPSFPVVGADEVKALMAGKSPPLLVDARTPQEFASGHIPGAINIPTLEVAAQPSRLPKSKGAMVVFYCRGFT